MLIFVSYLNKFDIFKSPGLWNRSDLGHMLVKGDKLFRRISKFSYHRVEDLLQEFLIKSYSVNLNFVGNVMREITAGAYLLSTAEIVNSGQ